jgi:hypothetical protein
MHVFQCPKCQLRFPSSSEMKEHLAVDHPDVSVKARGRSSPPIPRHRTRAI